MMKNSMWRWFAATGGFLYVFLQLIGLFVSDPSQSEPRFTAQAEEILSFFQSQDPGKASIAAYLTTLAFIAFLWFVGGLWSRLRTAEGHPGFLAWVAAGSGLISLIVLNANLGPVVMLRIENGLEPQLARYIFDLGNYSFATMWALIANMLLASGLASLRHHALPRWLAWFSLLDGLALLIAYPLWINEVGVLPFLLYWVWVIAVCIVLIRDPGVERHQDEAPEQFSITRPI
jgi:hypothetical protein